MAIAPALASILLKSSMAREPEPLPFGFDPLNDSAVRASMESQGLAIPIQNAPGSDVPQVQVGAQPTPIVGLPGRGAKIEEAARQEFRASQASIGARLAAALRASDIDAASRGVLRSGGQQGRRDDLRIAAIQAGAQAQGSIALDKLGLEQRAKEAQDRFDLTVAQLNAQKSQATNQLYTEVAKLMIKSTPDLFKLFGVGNQDNLGVGDQSLPIGFLDDFGVGTPELFDSFDVGGTA